MERRIITTDVLEEDVKIEGSLRPQHLDDYIGQEKTKKNLKVYIEAAKQRSDVLDHVLFYGPPGLGKTTLAGIIANEMGTHMKVTSGPAIEKPGEMAAILNNLQEGDVLFVDEIHRLNRQVEEVLYPAMEDFAIDIMIGAEIKKGKVVVFTEEVLTSAVIAAAWTSFYGGGITEAIIAMIAGAFVTILARYIKILAPNEMVLNFLLSFFVAAFAYISAKFGLTEDYGKIIIGNIMLLVPGVAFVNALRDMIGGDMMSGILRVCESILLAVFLAAGSFMALMFLGGVL